MKVKELIEFLQTLDPEIQVFKQGYEGGYEYIDPKNTIHRFVLDVNEEWWYGPHEKANNSIDDKDIVKGIIL